MAKQGSNIYFIDIDKEKCQELENYSVQYKSFF